MAFGSNEAGRANAAACEPQFTVYEEAARRWAAAKDQLLLAASEMQRALEQHAKADAEEQAAWTALLDVSGRGAPMAMEASAKPYRPLSR